jgi:peptide/nickel transport system substrate-binding protein
MDKRAIALAAAALLGVASLASAKTLRWASQGDYLTADPHAQNELLTNSINGQVYEALLTRGKNLELLPQLATKWEQVNPTTWRFHLRKNVRFHDGSPFTADDVVFSITRAQGPTSNFRVYGNAVGKPRKIDDHTVEFVQDAPNPIILQQVSNSLFIMSRAWAEKHGVEKAQDFTNKMESYAARNANGTGPYMLKSREPDVKSVLVKNSNWWGLKEGLKTGNVDEVIYTPIKAEGTRMAALLSGELDFVLDPPVQDLARLKGNSSVKVYEGKENRVIFLGMDQARDELLYSSVKGKNPFKDKRVRQAFVHAIDVEAIKSTVMRGLSVPTYINLPNPPVMGMPKELDKRPPVDLAAAKKLLAEAGYPNGFEVTLDCPNNRYINDEKICVAVAGMLAKVGVKVKVNAMPRANYFPKTQKLDTSFYMLGWGGATTDAMFTLQPVLHSRNDKGDGDYNWGNYKDPEFDKLIDAAKVDVDPKRRMETLIKAMKYHADNVFHIPLHLQMIPWASRANVSVIHRADNWLEIPWVVVK